MEGWLNNPHHLFVFFVLFCFLFLADVGVTQAALVNQKVIGQARMGMRTSVVGYAYRSDPSYFLLRRISVKHFFDSVMRLENISSYAGKKWKNTKCLFFKKKKSFVNLMETTKNDGNE